VFRGTARGVRAAGTLRTCALLRELREPRTALLLWTRVQCAVATSWCIGDAHIHVGVDTWIETMETVENYERVTPRNVDIN